MPVGRHNRNTQRFCMATEPAPPLAIGGPGSPGGKCTAIDSPQLWTVGTGPQLPGPQLPGPQLPGNQPIYVPPLLPPLLSVTFALVLTLTLPAPLPHH